MFGHRALRFVGMLAPAAFAALAQSTHAQTPDNFPHAPATCGEVTSFDEALALGCIRDDAGPAYTPPAPAAPASFAPATRRDGDIAPQFCPDVHSREEALALGCVTDPDNPNSFPIDDRGNPQLGIPNPDPGAPYPYGPP